MGDSAGIRLVTAFVAAGYGAVLKPILFRFDPESVHEAMTSFGEALGKVRVVRTLLKSSFAYTSSSLSQEIVGIKFANPVGLAAGFDYEAKLIQVLPALGFGFGTVGTITNLPYEGNPRPRLGRLPRSKSLLVNKGFKNDGIKAVIKKLERVSFGYPVGLSIGKTNSPTIHTQKEAIGDIISAFRSVENSRLSPAYYELNISCPNLWGNVSFYEPGKLEDLLTAVDKLRMKKPIFLKMPISKTNNEVLQMMEVVVRHKLAGVIIGNLQTDRTHPTLVPEEVERCGKGNFSGRPTYARSNELISLVYKRYGNKLVIIGCGGVFTAEDAYAKIKLGASLVQMITGMIYQGPQCISQINQGIAALLKRDGFSNIAEAVGTARSTKLLE